MANEAATSSDLEYADTLCQRIVEAELEACFGEGERLTAVVRERLKGVGDAG